MYKYVRPMATDTKELIPRLSRCLHSIQPYSDLMPGFSLAIGTPRWGRPGAHCFADPIGDAGLPTRLQKE